MNKRIISILLALAAVFGDANAQQNQGEAIPSTKTRRGLKEKQVGTAIMYVDYAMNADSIGQEQTYIDKQRLEIGRDCAKYSSLFLKQFVGSTRPTRDLLERHSIYRPLFQRWSGYRVCRHANAPRRQ